MSTADLKQLGFVPKVADASVKYAESWVSYTHEKLPASVKPTVEGLEAKITTTVAPVISTLTDKSDKILHVVDTQVRGLDSSGGRAKKGGARELGRAANSARRVSSARRERPDRRLAGTLSGLDRGAMRQPGGRS